jgi:hypothetical protein
MVFKNVTKFCGQSIISSVFFEIQSLVWKLENWGHSIMYSDQVIERLNAIVRN